MDYKDKIRKLLALAKSPEPEHPKAHMGPGQALLHDVRRAG